MVPNKGPDLLMRVNTILLILSASCAAGLLSHQFIHQVNVKSMHRYPYVRFGVNAHIAFESPRVNIDALDILDTGILSGHHQSLRDFKAISRYDPHRRTRNSVSK